MLFRAPPIKDLFLKNFFSFPKTKLFHTTSTITKCSHYNTPLSLWSELFSYHYYQFSYLTENHHFGRLCVKSMVVGINCVKTALASHFFPQSSGFVKTGQPRMPHINEEAFSKNFWSIIWSRTYSKILVFQEASWTEVSQTNVNCEVRWKRGDKWHKWWITSNTPATQHPTKPTRRPTPPTLHNPITSTSR